MTFWIFGKMGAELHRYETKLRIGFNYSSLRNVRYRAGCVKFTETVGIRHTRCTSVG